MEKLLENALSEKKDIISEAVQNEEVSSLARMRTMFNEAPPDEDDYMKEASKGVTKYQKYMVDAERKMKVLNRQLTKDFDFE